MKYGFYFFIVLLFISCDKEDSIKEKTTMELLTAHKWKLYTVGSSNDAINVEWEPHEWLDQEECDKDDYVQFTTNGRMINSGGSFRCSQNEQDINLGFTLRNNNTIEAENFVIFKIVKLTENELQIIEVENRPPHDCTYLVSF